MRQVISAILLLFLVGCTGKSVYVSADSATTIGSGFSDTDLEMMATGMYDSITQRLEAINQGETSIIALLPIKNKTTEHINTADIADKLQIQLIKAGTLRFVDRSQISAMVEQFDMAASGMMDQNTIKSAGSVLGNDYFLYGEISSIQNSNRYKRITYYRLSMRLLDAETNELIWADEYEIKKQSSKGMIDW